MPEEKIPYWVENTYPKQTYELQIIADTSLEIIDLTRDEYITLKAHLAAMRGYQAITAAEAIGLVNSTEGLSGYYDSDPQQIARHIETAREIYQQLPELVLTVSEAFDAEIEELAK